jgi:hypothetical protein
MIRPGPAIWLTECCPHPFFQIEGRQHVRPVVLLSRGLPTPFAHHRAPESVPARLPSAVRRRLEQWHAWLHRGDPSGAGPMSDPRRRQADGRETTA